MCLNVSKCNFSKKTSILEYSYKIHDTPLFRQDSVVDLGLIIDAKFNFGRHIDNIINRANSTLGFIKRWSRDFADPYVLKILFCAFVRPILEYASVVWMPHYGVHIKRIEAVQKRFLRFALRHLPWSDPYRLPPYEDRLKLLGLSSLSKRREVAGVIFVHDIIAGEVDSPNLLSLININSRPRATRGQNFIYLDHHRTNYGSFEPVSAMSKNYNAFSSLLDFHCDRFTLKSRLYDT